MPPISRRTAVLLVVAGTAIGSVKFAFRSDGLMERLSATRPPRLFLPRLSIESEYRPCSAAPGQAHIPVGACPGRTRASRAFIALSGEAAQQLRAEVTAETLQATALVDLLSPEMANKLDQAISSLESAARMSERPAPVLADLAAAYLLRAERTQNARDAGHAIEASEHAMELEPRNPVVLFNRALALEAWALDADAAAAWRDYLAVDAASGWAGEARRHLASATVLPAAVVRPRPGASTAEAREFAASAASEAREYGWDDLLGRWGEETVRGDSAAAGPPLRLAEALGSALEAQGGDASLADATREIRRHAGNRAATQVLAEAHRTYAQARAAMAEVAYDTAAERFRRVLARRPPSPPLLGWARQGYAAALTLDTMADSADATLKPLERTADSRRYPALAGRARWTRATIELRRKHTEAILRPAGEATALLIQAKEPDLAAGAQYVAADAESGIGAVHAAYASVREALWWLEGYPASVWRCNGLSAAARAALADDLPRAALRFEDERVEAARLNGRPEYRAEALAARAQMRAASGDLAGALRDARLGDLFLDRVAPGSSFLKLRGDLQIARALAYLPSQPSRAAATADSMVGNDAASGANGAPRLFQALVVRARARAALGDAYSAAADLDRATRTLLSDRTKVLETQLRISLFESAREAFNQLVMLRLAAGDTAGALAYLERGRVSFAAASRGRAAPAVPATPNGAAVLDYALIGDTLLAWGLGHGAPRLMRATVRRGELVTEIEGLNLRLERGDDESVVRPELERLFELLVRPFADQLGPADSPIVIVADGELGGVPFAALLDRGTNHYLVDDHVIRYASTLADAVGRARPTAPPARVTVTADPAYDTHAYQSLEPLAWAAAEGDSIRRLYPRAELVSGTSATRARVQSALRGAEVFHFSGHALFDPAQPERSSLVLAPERGATGPHPLIAADLDTMNLSGTRLVVLSACETIRASAGRGSAFAGFAAAFLGAGAGGVVGGSWRVDDVTSAQLMVAFHRAYRRSGDGAAALRSAQRTLLHSGNPELSSPSAWAAFRYAGN